MIVIGWIFAAILTAFLVFGLKKQSVVLSPVRLKRQNRPRQSRYRRPE